MKKTFRLLIGLVLLLELFIRFLDALKRLSQKN